MFTPSGNWQAIGPLWSKWGCKSWNLILEPQQVTAWPYTAWETVRLACHMQLGVPGDPGARMRDGVVERRNGERVFPVSELESITVEVRHSQNCIALAQLGGACERFFIVDRHRTENWMTILSDTYPNLYAETGVPTTLLGRVLKW